LLAVLCTACAGEDRPRLDGGSDASVEDTAVDVLTVDAFAADAPMDGAVPDARVDGPADARPGDADAAVPACDPIRYSFAAFTPPSFSQATPVPFGSASYSYEQLTWMKDPAVSYPVGTLRQAGYTIYSRDCGQTWHREDGFLPPLKLEGAVDQIGNGAAHFTTNLAVGFFAQGVVTSLRFDTLTSRLFPVFFDGVGWTYQELVAQQEPLPLVGHPTASIKDNFYSPSIVPLAGNATGAVYLYFGGWRHDYTRAAVADCDRPAVITSGGYQEKLCACNDFNQGTLAIDACTGDKIFVASNAGQANPLAYRVYQGGSSWSSDAWNAALFEPVIWPSLLNQTCVPSTCPFPLVHANDPTVVRTDQPTQPYVVYFTGGLYHAGGFVAYTHVGRSADGLSWSDFSILRTAPGVAFPAQLSQNNANGTVRAFYDARQHKIRLISVTTPDHPAIAANDPDAWKVFIYEIDPAQPAVVRSVRKIDQTGHQLAACAPGEAAPCATAHPY
jgi:hypothetical protein